MKVKEEFLLTDVQEVLKNNLTAVIMGTKLQEERCELVRKTFDRKNIKLIEVDYDKESEKFNCQTIGDSIVPQTVPIGIFAHFCKNKLLKDCSKNILLDLTSLQHSVIIVLLNILCNCVIPARLFASYVKPEQYLRRDYFGGYDFTQKVYEPAGIPGLIRQAKKEEIVIPFLGFEGNRLNNMLENISYEKVVPVIGFPAEDPSWQFESLRNCWHTLETACSNAEIWKCKADSIFDAIDVINCIVATYPNKNYVLLPLGIRPHTAACGLLAAKNKNFRILYDYVVETEKRTEGIGETLVYHLTRFL